MFLVRGDSKISTVRCGVPDADSALAKLNDLALSKLIDVRVTDLSGVEFSRDALETMILASPTSKAPS